MAKKTTKNNGTNTSIAKVEPGLGMSPEDLKKTTETSMILFLGIVAKNANLDKKPDGAEAGSIVLGTQDILTGPVRAAVLRMRPKAMLWTDGQLEDESYDPSSETFTMIKGKTRQGGKVGTEALLWLIDQEQYAICYSANAARAYGVVAAKAQQSGTEVNIDAEYVDGKKYQWWQLKFVLGDPIDPKTLPSEESQAKAIGIFESYKAEKPATTTRER